MESSSIIRAAILPPIPDYRQRDPDVATSCCVLRRGFAGAAFTSCRKRYGVFTGIWIKYGIPVALPMADPAPSPKSHLQLMRCLHLPLKVIIRLVGNKIVYRKLAGIKGLGMIIRC